MTMPLSLFGAMTVDSSTIKEHPDGEALMSSTRRVSIAGAMAFRINLEHLVR